MDLERLGKAKKTLEKYRAGKAALDRRIVENEQWYKMRHWEALRGAEGARKPASAWLLNSIANKHADAMDNFPTPVVLPREEGDMADAGLLTELLPVVLEENHFEEAYSLLWWRKLKVGTGAYGVFWNGEKRGGLGDIEVRAVDILNLYWEPGVTDIQNGRNLFCVELADDEALEEQYPTLVGKLGSQPGVVRDYVHDESIDTSGKSVVVDWYYKAGGEVHLCKFVNDTVLYASEDDPALGGRGFYAHGLYPFVLDTLFPDEDGPAGFGYLDVCKDPQTRIDELNDAIVKNAVMAARPRFFIKGDGGVNEGEFADWNRDFVHFLSGGAPQESIMPIETAPLPAGVLSVLQGTIDELKETSGNRDFSQGSTSAGVTAASAIAALQEAGSKLSRDMIKAGYRAFVSVCQLVIELMREFYDEPRCFRVVGAEGAARFIRYDNQGLRPREVETDQSLEWDEGDAGEDGTGTTGGAAPWAGEMRVTRVPVFDISVRAQKASPFAVVAQNELAREFYAAGFFNPEMADQALLCLEMMTFEGKERVVERIARNATLWRRAREAERAAAEMAGALGMQREAE